MSTAWPTFKIKLPLTNYTVDSSSDFVQKSLETYATRILLLLVGFATSIVIARSLGPAGRGQFAVALVLGALGVQFGNLGLHTANTFFVARDPSTLRQLWGNSLWVSLLMGTTLAAGALAFQAWIPALALLQGKLLYLSLLSIPIGLAFLLGQNLVLGLQNVRVYNAVESANKIAALALILLVIAWGRTTVESIFFATVLATLLGLSILAWFIRKRYLGGPSSSFQIFRSNLRYGMTAYWAALFSFLVLRADLLLVQKFLGSEQAGYYGIAVNVADYVAILPTVVGSILFPKLSALKDTVLKLHLTKQASVGTAFILAPVLILAGLVSYSAIPFLFGEAFRQSVPAFVWLLPGMFFLGIHAVSVQFLNSIGYPVIVVWIWGGCALLNIFLNLWVIPIYGIQGASIVSSISYFLAFLAIVAVIYNHRNSPQS
jgi:O-antigen/teichoic acid export membrane protein